MSAMLTYTYNLANGGEEIIHTRVRDVLGLGTQTFPLRNPNGTPVKPTRNGVTVTVTKVDGVYRIESKQEGLKYREISSDGSTTWILLTVNDFVELTEDIQILEWEFETSGGIRHRFSLTLDNKKSKTGGVAIKKEDAPAPVSAPASAIEGAPKPTEAVDGTAKPVEAPKPAEAVDGTAKPVEAPKPAEAVEAPETAEDPKSTVELSTKPTSLPNPAVAARAQARVNAKEAFQAAGEAALPGSNWGNARPGPAIKKTRFDQAAIDASAAAAKDRADYYRRRREQMEADLLGGAPGGSLEQPTQPTNMDVGDTQPVMADVRKTQAVMVDVSETQPVVVDQRYAVLTVIKVPSDVGVRLHSSYVLEGDYSIGRLLDCDMVLRDPNGQFSRKAIVVKDNGDAGVTAEIHGTNGVIVKSVDGKATTYPGIVPGSEPKKVQVRFGDEFSIPRGGCDLSDVGNHPTFKVTKPM